MAEHAAVDLVAEDGKEDTTDIAELARQQREGEQAAAAEVPEGTEPADEEPAGDEAAAPEEKAAPVAPEDAEEAPTPAAVPYPQYARLYGKAKEQDRRIAFLEQTLTKLGGAQSVPQTSPAQQAAKTQLHPAAKFVQDAFQPLAENLTQRLARIEQRDSLRDAKEYLHEFWAGNDDFKDLRPEVDKVYLEAVRDGNEVDPDLILNAILGRKHRTQSEARRSVAAQTVQRVAQANKSARTEMRSTAVPAKPGAGKKFSQMSTKEIEDAFGKTTIWRRGKGGVVPEDAEDEE